MNKHANTPFGDLQESNRFKDTWKIVHFAPSRRKILVALRRYLGQSHLPLFRFLNVNLDYSILKGFAKKLSEAIIITLISKTMAPSSQIQCKEIST